MASKAKEEMKESCEMENAEVRFYDVRSSNTCTKVPAEHYSKLPILNLYLEISHCVISTLHFTSQKVPAAHYSKLQTLYLYVPVNLT